MLSKSHQNFWTSSGPASLALLKIWLQFDNFKVPNGQTTSYRPTIHPPHSTDLRFKAGADLSRLDLRNINFKYANMRGCNLSGANLSWSNLERVDLSRGTLDGAVM